MLCLEYTITGSLCGKQIREILKLLGFSTQSRKLLRNTLLVDGAAVPVYFVPQPGQTITIPLPADPPSPIEPVEGPLDIRYEDDHLLVVNKAPGVTVHPGPDHHGDTLGNFLAWHYQQQGENHLFRPVNRLDKGTSGLMVVAKHAYAAQRLSQALHAPGFLRSYLALCEGIPEPPEGIIDAPIGRKDGSVIAREVRGDGKNAVTQFRIIQNYVNYSLIEVFPQTGRTHQIRVHMAHLGHPLLGDFLYGTENPALISRPALHSARLDFLHPITGTQLHFSAPLPYDMQNLLL